jgi:hypothetical protein
VLAATAAHFHGALSFHNNISAWRKQDLTLNLNQSELKMISKLPKLQKDILRKMVIAHPRAPKEFTFGELYRKFNYGQFTEDEVSSALQALVDAGYFKESLKHRFVFTRPKYLEVRNHYKVSIFFSDITKLLTLAGIFVVLLLLALTYLTARYVSTDFSITGSPDSKLVELENRVLRLEAMLRDSGKISGELSDSLTFKGILFKIASLDSAISGIAHTTGLEPSKIVELANLRSEVSYLKESQKNQYDSIIREVDRISSYNKTIIIFMITFLVAGLGVVTVVLKKREGT